MAKIRLTSYTFDASAKTVLASQFSDVGLAGIQLIVNVTDQVIIYNFADSSKGGTLSTDTLTLEYDTTTMDDADELMILVEDGVQSTAITAASLPLPTGAATSAKQDTIIGHVDGIEAVLGTIDADTGNISTKIDTIAGAVSGTEMQVDVLTMPTITVNSHAVTNAGTFVTQENGAALTALQLIDDTVYTDGSGTVTKGIAILGQDGTNPQAIKTDASGELQVDVLTMPTVAVTQSGTWDEVGINDSGNSITVDDGGTTLSIDDGAGSITVDGTVAVSGTVTVGSHAVTNAGTFAVQVDGNALTSLQLLDDTVFAEDVAAQAADKGIAILAVRRDADTSLVGADNDYANLQVNANGALKTEVFSGETLPVSLTSTTITGTVAVTQSGTWDEIGINDSGNSITVDGTVTASIAAGATTIAKAEDAASADADVGVPAMAVRKGTPANTSGTDGDYEMLQMSAGRLWTSSTIDAALPAGTNAIGKLAANSGVDIGDVDVTSVGTITPGTAATSLGKAEDAAHASGDTGVFALAVRNDNLGTTYGADQDYAPIAVDLKGAVITTQKAATASQSSVGGSASSVTVLAANSARRGAVINNDSTAILYLKLGATASTTSYTYKMYTDDCVEVPFGYTGIIDGIWASATGNARITELS